MGVLHAEVPRYKIPEKKSRLSHRVVSPVNILRMDGWMANMRWVACQLEVSLSGRVGVYELARAVPTMAGRRRSADHRAPHQAVRGGRKDRSGQTALYHPSMVRNVRKGSSPETHDDLCTAAVDLPAADLDDLADRDRLVATEVEDPLQDEVGVEPGGAESGRVTGFEGQRQQGTRIEGPVVVGITRQDRRWVRVSASWGCVLVMRRVPRIRNGGSRRLGLVRENLSCEKPGRNRTVERPHGSGAERVGRARIDLIRDSRGNLCGGITVTLEGGAYGFEVAPVGIEPTTSRL